MEFSIIVSTIGRLDDLSRMLESLAAQTINDFETIVVDQSRESAVGKLCNRFRDTARVIHAPMSGRGLSRARNFGLTKASGRVVTFADDDCIYPADLLSHIRARFRDRPELDGISVRSRNVEGTGSVTRFDDVPGLLTAQNMFSKFVEFGLFLKGDSLGEVRFDELMGVGAGTPWAADEGLDLLLRLFDKNVRILYCPDLVVFHPAPQLQADPASIKRQFSYGCGRGRLFRKHKFPLTVIAHSMGRTAAGALLMMSTLRWQRARGYFASFRGKVQGMLHPYP